MNAQAELPTLAAPDAINHEGRREVIGVKAHLLLAAVIRHGKRLAVSEANSITSGTLDAPRGRLDSLIYRINLRLAALGYQARLSVDGDELLVI